MSGHRKSTFDIARIEVVDAFAGEKMAFQARFGGDVPLVRCLARPDPGALAAERTILGAELFEPLPTDDLITTGPR